MPAQTRWYNDGEVLRSFGRALIAAEVLEDISEVDAFLEKPWNLKDTYAVWDEAGAPEEIGDPGWKEFVDQLTEDDEEEDEPE